MARVINRAAGSIAEKYGNAVNGISSVVTTGPVQKLWRARILTNRLASGLEKASPILPGVAATLDAIKNPLQTIQDIGQSIAGIKPGPSTLVTRIQRKALVDSGKNGFPIYYDGEREIDIAQATFKPVIDYLTSKEEWENLIEGGDWTRASNKVIIYNTTISPYQYLELQNRPTQIDFRGEATWATIKSMGRNLPMYHFTSAEDIYQFNISWYCNDPENPAEVLNKCRLLESWTKANAYQNAPPTLQIQWGDSNIFSGYYFILTSATYSLANFQSGARMRNLGGENPSNQKYMASMNKGLYPYTATQELIFKRVLDHNPSSDEITGMDRYMATGRMYGKTLQETKGVTYDQSR